MDVGSNVKCVGVCPLLLYRLVNIKNNSSKNELQTSNLLVFVWDTEIMTEWKNENCEE